jgi:hypothetical protein
MASNILLAFPPTLLYSSPRELELEHRQTLSTTAVVLASRSSEPCQEPPDLALPPDGRTFAQKGRTRSCPRKRMMANDSLYVSWQKSPPSGGAMQRLSGRKGILASFESILHRRSISAVDRPLGTGFSRTLYSIERKGRCIATSQVAADGWSSRYDLSGLGNWSQSFTGTDQVSPCIRKSHHSRRPAI